MKRDFIAKGENKHASQRCPGGEAAQQNTTDDRTQGREDKYQHLREKRRAAPHDQPTSQTNSQSLRGPSQAGRKRD